MYVDFIVLHIVSLEHAHTSFMLSSGWILLPSQDSCRHLAGFLLARVTLHQYIHMGEHLLLSHYLFSLLLWDVLLLPRVRHSLLSAPYFSSVCFNLDDELLPLWHSRMNDLSMLLVFRCAYSDLAYLRLMIFWVSLDH